MGLYISNIVILLNMTVEKNELQIVIIFNIGMVDKLKAIRKYCNEI